MICILISVCIEKAFEQTICNVCKTCHLDHLDKVLSLLESGRHFKFSSNFNYFYKFFINNVLIDVILREI